MFRTQEVFEDEKYVRHISRVLKKNQSQFLFLTQLNRNNFNNKIFNKPFYNSLVVTFSPPWKIWSPNLIRTQTELDIAFSYPPLFPTWLLRSDDFATRPLPGVWSYFEVPFPWYPVSVLVFLRTSGCLQAVSLLI